MLYVPGFIDFQVLFSDILCIQTSRIKSEQSPNIYLIFNISYPLQYCPHLGLLGFKNRANVLITSLADLPKKSVRPLARKYFCLRTRLSPPQRQNLVEEKGAKINVVFQNGGKTDCV